MAVFVGDTSIDNLRHFMPEEFGTCDVKYARVEQCCSFQMRFLFLTMAKVDTILFEDNYYFTKFQISY